MAVSKASLGGLKKALREKANPARAKSSAWFFKTGPGEYGEGDRFLGVTVPEQRRLARQFRDLPLNDCIALLKSPWHEERLTAVFLLVSRYQRAKDEPNKKTVVDAYLKNLKWINNWDIVDSSAHKILGDWLLTRDRRLIDKLAKSKSLWERRVAVIATAAFIAKGDFKDILRLSKILLKDKEDLMHKATGWMLREVGNYGGLKELRSFLAVHAKTMPRTMLRYSIEKLAPAERKRWMGKKA